jgi:hypothetical protein
MLHTSVNPEIRQAENPFLMIAPLYGGGGYVAITGIASVVQALIIVRRRGDRCLDRRGSDDTSPGKSQGGR